MNKLELKPSTFTPIGVVHSCFKEKFTIPRQPGLVPSSFATLELNGSDRMRVAIKGLEGFSHLWVLFEFHQTGSNNWKPSVRPPRLGGKKKVGVLASRSPHRPNPIGMSVVKLDEIHVPEKKGPITLRVSGIDLLDGTPIFDIKPYLPYCDSLPRARSGWAQERVKKTPVKFTPLALKAIRREQVACGSANLKKLIVEILTLDPRPASQRVKAERLEEAQYGFALLDFDVKWETTPDGKFLVTDLVRLR